MNYLILIGPIIGLLIGIFVLAPLSKKRMMKKIKPIKEFLDILIIDFKAKIMARELLSGTPPSEIPTDFEVVIKKYYPKLPPYNKIFNFPVHELIDKVDWTIDPREFFLEKDKK
jgi:hypothetical protein